MHRSRYTYGHRLVSEPYSHGIPREAEILRVASYPATLVDVDFRVRQPFISRIRTRQKVK